MRDPVPSGSWHDDSGKMKVYCIKTMYNKNDRYGLNESTDYVLFKKQPIFREKKLDLLLA
jgi:hypothetical protein